MKKQLISCISIGLGLFSKFCSDGITLKNKSKQIRLFQVMNRLNVNFILHY
jgi:hypothetical protein